MFINTGGLPEQHIHHGGKLHLHHQHHHHGHRNLQQFGQLHHRRRSRRLAARRHPLLPDSRHHGSLSPAALLLKFRPRQNPSHPPFFSLPQHSSHLPSHNPTQSSLTPLSHRDHKTNMDGLHNLLRPP